MTEYIDKSTLLRSFAPIYEHDRYTGLTFETAKQIIADHINSLPTINIVHCKNCKYKVGENTEYNDAHCGIHERGNNRELTVGDYDYCSWGELEGGEE